MPFEKHERLGSLGDHVQALSDQPAADATPVQVGSYADRAEHQHVDEPSGCVEDGPGVEDVAEELAVVAVGDEGQLVLPRP